MSNQSPKSTLRHIAFIMDGNRRWAEARGLPKGEGHRAGAEAFRRVVKHCNEIEEIEAVTVYAFSTENWKRPKNEVTLLMNILYNYLEKSVDEMNENGVRFRVIGDKSAFSDKLRKKIDEVEKITAGNPKLLNVALNYGGRDEIVRAFNLLAEKGKKNITESDISSALYTNDCPDPDLIVRTSGELRLSNFLIWQAAYSEFYFTDILWPDMNAETVDAAIAAYKTRGRRFGGV